MQQNVKQILLLVQTTVVEQCLSEITVTTSCGRPNSNVAKISDPPINPSEYLVQIIQKMAGASGEPIRWVT